MTRKCPDLHDPLKEGFHSGGNGGQGHSHDEEDSASMLGRCVLGEIVEIVKPVGCGAVLRAEPGGGLSVELKE